MLAMSLLVIQCKGARQNTFSDFAKPLWDLSSQKYIASRVVQNGLEITLCIWLASQFVMSWPCRQPLFEKWLDWCMEKERASLTEDEIEVSAEISAGISGYCRTHLIPVTWTEIKEGMGTSANHWSIWSAWPDGPFLFILKTEVKTKENFTKWAFNKLVKLYL